MRDIAQMSVTSLAGPNAAQMRVNNDASFLMDPSFYVPPSVCVINAPNRNTIQLPYHARREKLGVMARYFRTVSALN